MFDKILENPLFKTKPKQECEVRKAAIRGAERRGETRGVAAIAPAAAEQLQSAARCLAAELRGRTLCSYSAPLPSALADKHSSTV